LKLYSVGDGDLGVNFMPVLATIEDNGCQAISAALTLFVSSSRQFHCESRGSINEENYFREISSLNLFYSSLLRAFFIKKGSGASRDVH
jgi:hypothetical protein